MAQLRRVKSFLLAFRTLAFCSLLLSLPWVSVTLPSGCLRSTGCLSDFRIWSQRVSYPGGVTQVCLVPFPERSPSPFSLGFAHPDPLWIPFKEVAVTLTYQLAESPDVLCAQMLQGCAKQVLEKLEKNATEADPSKWAGASLLRGGVDSQPLSTPNLGPRHLSLFRLMLGHSLPRLTFSMSEEWVWKFNGTWLFSFSLL